MATQVNINVTDEIPPINQATIDGNGMVGNTYDKTQLDSKIEEAHSEAVAGYGIPRVATISNTPPNNPETTKHEAFTAGTYTNWLDENGDPIEVTEADVADNDVLFFLKNGVVEIVQKTPKKTPYDDYLATTTDSPVKTKAEFVESLKGEVSTVQAKGQSTTDVMSQKAVTDEVSRIDSYIYQYDKKPANRALTGFTGPIDNSYWFEDEDWFNGLDRILHTVTLGAIDTGVVGVALFTISGTTATLFSSKNLNVVAGTNIFTATEISDTPPVVGTKYYVAFKKVTGNSVGYAMNNTGKGRNIPNANPTTVNTNNASLSYYLTLKKEVLTNNQDFNFADELLKKNNILIPEGTHNLSEKAVVRSGQTVKGIKGKSFIKVAKIAGAGIEVKDIDNVTLEDFDVIGSDANTTMNGNDVAAGKIDNIDEAVNLTNIGASIGIWVKNSKKVTLKDVEATNFDGHGVLLEDFGQLYNDTSKLINVYAKNNFAGISFVNKGEYNTIIGCHSNRNQIGAIVDAGNNMFSGCNFTGNRVNVLIKGGANNAHGSLVGCSVNHASLYGWVIDGVSNGQTISGCNSWYSHIYVRNSKGILFNGCLLAQSTVYADGNYAGGGTWMISNSMVQSLTINHNYNGNTSNLKLKNNWKMDGTDSSLINN